MVVIISQKIKKQKTTTTRNAEPSENSFYIHFEWLHDVYIYIYDNDDDGRQRVVVMVFPRKGWLSGKETMRAYAVRVLNFLSGPRGGLSLKFWTALTNDTGPRYWHTPLHRRRRRRVHYSPRCRAVKYIKDGWIFATGKYANAHTRARGASTLTYYTYWYRDHFEFFFFPSTRHWKQYHIRVIITFM